MLISILKHKIHFNHMSIRQAAREIGISHTTLQRTLTGSALDLDTLMKICRFLGVRPEVALNSMEDAASTDQVVLLFLQSEPELLQQISKAIRQYKADHLEMNDLKEILGFITFKLQKGQATDKSDHMPPF